MIPARGWDGPDVDQAQPGWAYLPPPTVRVGAETSSLGSADFVSPPWLPHARFTLGKSGHQDDIEEENEGHAVHSRRTMVWMDIVTKSWHHQAGQFDATAVPCREANGTLIASGCRLEAPGSDQQRGSRGWLLSLPRAEPLCVSVERHAVTRLRL